MLPASAPAPKSGAKQPPRPRNWRGVGEGLASARRLFDRGSLTLAEDTLLEILEFAPSEARAWHLLGKVLQAQERHDEALAHFERAERLYGGAPAHRGRTEPPASTRLARLLWSQGQREEARRMLAGLRAADPDNDELRELARAWESAA